MLLTTLQSLCHPFCWMDEGTHALWRVAPYLELLQGGRSEIPTQHWNGTAPSIDLLTCHWRSSWKQLEEVALAWSPFAYCQLPWLLISLGSDASLKTGHMSSSSAHQGSLGRAGSGGLPGPREVSGGSLNIIQWRALEMRPKRMRWSVSSQKGLDLILFLLQLWKYSSWPSFFCLTFPSNWPGMCWPIFLHHHFPMVLVTIFKFLIL